MRGDVVLCIKLRGSFGAGRFQEANEVTTEAVRETGTCKTLQYALLCCLCLSIGTSAASAATLAEALGATNGIWRTGGDAPWFVDTNTFHGGLASIRSGSVTEGQTSWVEVEIEGAATLNSVGR